MTEKRKETKYMKVVQLSAKQRKKIVRLVKPRKNEYDSYQNLNLLTPVGGYLVTCRKEAGEYRGIFSPIPMLVSKEKIRELIQYYEDSFSERYFMEKEAKKELNLAGKGFTEWYLELYYF